MPSPFPSPTPGHSSAAEPGAFDILDFASVDCGSKAKLPPLSEIGLPTIGGVPASPALHPDSSPSIPIVYNNASPISVAAGLVPVSPVSPQSPLSLSVPPFQHGIFGEIEPLSSDRPLDGSGRQPLPLPETGGTLQGNISSITAGNTAQAFVPQLGINAPISSLDLAASDANTNALGFNFNQTRQRHTSSNEPDRPPNLVEWRTRLFDLDEPVIMSEEE